MKKISLGIHLYAVLIGFLSVSSLRATAVTPTGRYELGDSVSLVGANALPPLNSAKTRWKPIESQPPLPGTQTPRQALFEVVNVEDLPPREMLIRLVEETKYYPFPEHTREFYVSKYIKQYLPLLSRSHTNYLATLLNRCETPRNCLEDFYIFFLDRLDADPYPLSSYFFMEVEAEFESKIATGGIKLSNVISLRRRFNQLHSTLEGLGFPHPLRNHARAGAILSSKSENGRQAFRENNKLPEPQSLEAKKFNLYSHFDQWFQQRKLNDISDEELELQSFEYLRMLTSIYDNDPMWSDPFVYIVTYALVQAKAHQDLARVVEGAKTILKEGLLQLDNWTQPSSTSRHAIMSLAEKMSKPAKAKTCNDILN